MKELVLVTGGSGSVATHCILQLLEAGYRVRATLRSAARAGGAGHAARGRSGGRHPRSRDDTIVETAESLLRLCLLK